MNFNKAKYAIIDGKLSKLQWETIWDRSVSVDRMVKDFCSTIMPIIKKNNTPLRKSIRERYSAWYSSSPAKCEKKGKT